MTLDVICPKCDEYLGSGPRADIQVDAIEDFIIDCDSCDYKGPMFEEKAGIDTEDLKTVAKFLHEQWCDWSKSIAQEEHITEDRLNRWIGYWFKDWEELDSDTREKDLKRAVQLKNHLRTTEEEKDESE